MEAFSFFYKKTILLLLHKVYFDHISFTFYDLFLKNLTKKTRAANQFVIPMPRTEFGRTSLRYRGPVIWNFLNRITDVPDSLNGFKRILVKYSGEITSFSFEKEATQIANKLNDFIYF